MFTIADFQLCEIVVLTTPTDVQTKKQSVTAAAAAEGVHCTKLPYLTGLDQRNRQRGYSEYLPHDSHSSEQYWSLLCGDTVFQQLNTQLAEQLTPYLTTTAVNATDSAIITHRAPLISKAPSTQHHSHIKKRKNNHTSLASREDVLIQIDRDTNGAAVHTQQRNKNGSGSGSNKMAMMMLIETVSGGDRHYVTGQLILRSVRKD